jgi:vacuolar-type H+-ATPase subunit H
MMAKMESATNQLVARFHEEQETLLRNFREYQDRVREEIGQMVATLRGKYEYILELRNQERQREKQQLVEQFESEANSLIRDISEGYEVRELQLISELERTKMATQAQQLEFLRNSETEMASRALREDSLLRRRGA